MTKVTELPSNLMHCEQGTTFKLTQELLEGTSYQFVTKAYKVLTGKADFIGKKKLDLIPQIVGKTYTEPTVEVKQPKTQSATQSSSTPITPTVPKLKRVIDTIMEEEAEALAKVHFHKSVATLKKIVTPLQSVVEAAWNREIDLGTYFKPALSIGEKVVIDSNQDDVAEGYVRVVRSHDKSGKFTEILSTRNFRNLNEPDWSELYNAARNATKKALQAAYTAHE